MNIEHPPLRAQSGGYGPPGGYGGPPPGAPAGGYGAPPGGDRPPEPPRFGAPYGDGAPSAARELKKQATTWLIVSGVSFLLCSGVNCFGLIGAILCFLAMQAADQGHVLDAESKLKWGKIITVTGAVLSLIGIALSLLYYFVVAAVT